MKCKWCVDKINRLTAKYHSPHKVNLWWWNFFLAKLINDWESYNIKVNGSFADQTVRCDAQCDCMCSGARKMTLEYINLSHKFNCPLTKVPSHHHEELSSLRNCNTYSKYATTASPSWHRKDYCSLRTCVYPCGILVFARAMGNLKSRAHDGTVTSLVIFSKHRSSLHCPADIPWTLLYPTLNTFIVLLYWGQCLKISQDWFING